MKSLIGPSWAQALVSRIISTSMSASSAGCTVWPITPIRFVGIDERQVRRRRLAVDDPHVFAERLQHAGHAQLAAQGVAVGADVADQQEPLVRADDFGEAGPVDGHECKVPRFKVQSCRVEARSTLNLEL